MYGTQRSLKQDIEVVFERACRERDLMVAEHLLQALEAIAQRDGDDAPVRRAYLALARDLPGRQDC